MTDAVGKRFTVTVMALEFTVPQLFVLVTEYVPGWETVMEALLCPLLQVPPVFPERVTEPPWQKVVLPDAEITDAVGRGFTVIVIALEFTVPQLFVFVTENVPG